MSLTTATPVFAICYHKKTRDFMNDYELGEFAVDDEQLNFEKGTLLIDKMLENADEIHMKMSQKSREIADFVERDLNEVIK